MNVKQETKFENQKFNWVCCGRPMASDQYSHSYWNQKL